MNVELHATGSTPAHKHQALTVNGEFVGWWHKPTARILVPGQVKPSLKGKIAEATAAVVGISAAAVQFVEPPTVDPSSVPFSSSGEYEYSE